MCQSLCLFLVSLSSGHDGTSVETRLYLTNSLFQRLLNSEIFVVMTHHYHHLITGFLPHLQYLLSFWGDECILYRPWYRQLCVEYGRFLWMQYDVLPNLPG